MNIRKYTLADRNRLGELFVNALEADNNYISHGEIQMGLSYDGKTYAPDFKTKWTRYLDRQYNEPKSFIYVYEDNGVIVGFIIFGAEDDHDKDFGVIYDIVLADDYKGTGAADKLYQYAINYFKSVNITDCYIESGVNNHRAHKFFERRGFSHVSNIYRLTNITITKK